MPLDNRFKVLSNYYLLLGLLSQEKLAYLPIGDAHLIFKAEDAFPLKIS